MQKCRFIGLVVVVAIVLLAAAGTPAQTVTTGQILGDVTDPSGGVVGGAKVVVTSDAGAQRDTVTSSTGRYAFSLLPPGKYRLEISASGFAPAMVDEVIVKITETTSVDVRLTLASQKSESITVQAAPPLVQTENAGHGTVIEQTEIRQLPLPTRNFQQLLTLTPGTSGPVQNSSELGRGAAPIYVNGLRATSNSVIINGTDANQWELVGAVGNGVKKVSVVFADKTTTPLNVDPRSRLVIWKGPVALHPAELRTDASECALTSGSKQSVCDGVAS